MLATVHHYILCYSSIERCGGPEKGLFHLSVLQWCLTAETVQCASLAFQGVHNVHGSDCFPLGVLSVGDSIADNVLEEHLQHATGLFVDKARDTLDTATAGQTANGGLGDTLDVVAQHLPVTLGATLAESLSSFTASGHVAGTVQFTRLKLVRLLAGPYI